MEGPIYIANASIHPKKNREGPPQFEKMIGSGTFVYIPLGLAFFVISY